MTENEQLHIELSILRDDLAAAIDTMEELAIALIEQGEELSSKSKRVKELEKEIYELTVSNLAAQQRSYKENERLRQVLKYM